MIADCFLPQLATKELINNVASFCSECYNDIFIEETVFYDMKHCCYICSSCREKLQENLDMHCEPIATGENSLF